jgi:hypothetical protein
MDIDDVGRIIGGILGAAIWLGAVGAMIYAARYIFINGW